VIRFFISPPFDFWIDYQKQKKLSTELFPRHTKETVEVLRAAHEKRIRTLAIKASLIAPLARYAGCIPHVRCQMDSFIAPHTSLFSPALLLVDATLSLVVQMIITEVYGMIVVGVVVEGWYWTRWPGGKGSPPWPPA
jgi:hypothetical protein